MHITWNLVDFECYLKVNFYRNSEFPNECFTQFLNLNLKWIIDTILILETTLKSLKDFCRYIQKLSLNSKFLSNFI